MLSSNMEQKEEIKSEAMAMDGCAEMMSCDNDDDWGFGAAKNS